MTIKTWGTITSAAALVLGAAAAAKAEPAQAPTAAEQVHRLGIMLMVGSLVCRDSQSNNWASYERFAVRHSASINSAHRDIAAEFESKHGTAGGKDAMDQFSVRLANEYGQGHPWMDCAELDTLTASLAEFGEHSDLVSTAEFVLGAEPAVEEPVLLAVNE